MSKSSVTRQRPVFPPTRLDRYNNRPPEEKEAERARLQHETDTFTRREEIRKRPSWELMRLHTNLPYEDDDGREQTLPAGHLVLRINTVEMLKAIFWPHCYNYNMVPGMAFPEGEKQGRFDRDKGFENIDEYLEPAPDAEAALPRKCLVCGNAADNRGMFSGEEPVFFCNGHYDARLPALMPAEGYCGKTRADRT